MDMNIAYTMTPGRGDTDLLLLKFAASVAAKGLRACGTVQINALRQDAGPCDMSVKVLPDGPVLRISQPLGAGARVCRLDPAALEDAVGLVSSSLVHGADILIVNKFGKHEAEGRGFRGAIADALSMDIPVLVGLNALNKNEFEKFASDAAVALPPDEAALLTWLEATVRAANFVSMPR
jgi:nucleoside-triphosphatase THEP1